MKNELSEMVQAIAHNIKFGAVVAGSTLATGFADVMQWIDSNLGHMATFLGLCLSVTLIVTHIDRMRRERKRDRIELAILMRKENERLEVVRRRQQEGKPTLRKDD